MYATVIAALDGSKNAEKVLPFLEPVLRAANGTAVLVQVLPPGEPAPEAAAAAYLKAIAAKLSRKKIRVTTEIARGEAADAIVEAAERHRADLMAFTSHGKGGLGRWVFGSVAQKLVRGCSRTLLVVRALEEKSPRVARIVLALDGSAGSEATLPHALTLARAFGASIELVYVADSEGIEAESSKLRGWLTKEKRRMETRFCEIERSAPDLRFDQSILEGDAATRILERAEGRPGGFVAMGCHGRTGLGRWVYGSVSEKVLQAARVPILVARHSPHP